MLEAPFLRDAFQNLLLCCIFSSFPTRWIKHLLQLFNIRLNSKVPICVRGRLAVVILVVQTHSKNNLGIDR